MSHQFTHAIVRTPSVNFAEGLTSVDLGAPDFDRALDQHRRYSDALAACGLRLLELPPDPEFPDSTFVEDTAILTPRGAVLARPGAASRRGEADEIRSTLAQFFPQFCSITAPGTLDGGDICAADDHFFIGISARTNESGARQLAAFLEAMGYTSSLVDIRGRDDILHLKSGVAALGEGRLVAIDSLAEHPAFQGYEIVRVQPEEAYAANCVRVNDSVLVPAGYPQLSATLMRLGYRIVELNMSEFRKMDGGLSCLSLRF